MVRVENLTVAHLKAAADDLRLEDRMEWLAAGGVDIVPYLMSYEGGLGHSFARVAVDGDGTVLCFWGVNEDHAGSKVGSVWLVATNSAVPRARAIHKHLKPELDEVHHLFPTIHCWADCRNAKHHEWLRWLGFVELETRHYGVLGLPFKHFQRIRKD